MPLYKSSSICVRAPHHITGFWLPIYTNDLMTTGSLGAGLLVSPFTQACYHETNESLITIINDKEYYHSTLHKAISILQREVNLTGKVIIEEPLPLAVGYGTSASITLSTLLSLEKIVNKSKLELAQLAHMSEVMENTGLGDVLSIFKGRELVVRTRPGAPGIGEVFNIKLPGNTVVITCALGTMSTKIMLHNYKELIEKTGFKIFNEFLKKPDVQNFLYLSKEFSKEIGFLSRELDDALSQLCKDCLGYYAKKKVLTIVLEEPLSQDLIINLKKQKICVMGTYVHYPIKENTWIND